MAFPSLPGFSSGGGSVSDSSTLTAASGFGGTIDFGGFGGVTLNARPKAQDDPTVWVVGLAAFAFLLFALKRGR